MAEKDIVKLVAGKSREESVIGEFFRLAEKAKDKFQLRKLEEKLLKPKPIAPYKGAKTSRTDFKKRTLMLALPNESHIQRWAKIIRVNQYKDNNTWDVDIFVELLNLLESGRLKFDRKEKKFKAVLRKGRKLTL